MSAYIFDKTSTNNGAPRNVQVFINDFNAALPGNIKYERPIITSQGFIIHFVNKADVNLIFLEEVRNKLNDKNLSAELTKGLAKKREIFSPDPHDNIFNKSYAELLREVRQQTNNKVVHVKSFRGSAGRKYIILTTDTNSSRDEILTNTHLKLFDLETKIELPFDKNRSSQNHGRVPETDTTPMSNDLRQPGGVTRNHEARHHTFPGPPRGHPISDLSNDQHWPPLTPPAGRRSTAKGRAPDLTFRPELEFYVLATTQLVQILQRGMENPWNYIHGINQLYSYHGLPYIEFPHSQILQSRKIFESKISPPHPTQFPNPSNPPNQTPPISIPRSSAPPPNHTPPGITPSSTSDSTQTTTTSAVTVPITSVLPIPSPTSLPESQSTPKIPHPLPPSSTPTCLPESLPTPKTSNTTPIISTASSPILTSPAQPLSMSQPQIITTSPIQTTPLAVTSTNSSSSDLIITSQSLRRFCLNTPSSLSEPASSK